MVKKIIMGYATLNVTMDILAAILCVSQIAQLVTEMMDSIVLRQVIMIEGSLVLHVYMGTVVIARVLVLIIKNAILDIEVLLLCVGKIVRVI
jgi:hypothetical protein